MKNIFRKLAIVLIAGTMSMAANAQLNQEDVTLGVKGFVAFDNSYTNFGIGAKITYNIFESFRLGGEFDYFFKKDDLTQWNAMAYVHYVFKANEKLGIYPLIGAGIVGASQSVGGVTISASEFGSAAGIGADFMLSDKISLNVEFKVLFDKDFNTGYIGGVGIGFKL